MVSMKSKGDPHKEFEKTFAKSHAGYVLITCDQPAGNGEMKVEMTYGGSPHLANMLIDGAQSYLNEASEMEELVLEEMPKVKLVKS